MGIKNLLKFLSDYPNVLNTKHTKEYSGKKIAIDISILLYQVVIAIRNSGSDLTNDKGEITSHILGLFNKTLNFLDNGIIPVYVFDGKPPILKQKVLDTRKQIRKRALEKLEEADNELDKIKYLKRSVVITREQNEQCHELLELMGIPYIDAIEEADSELANLCKNNMVYAVLTEDMDILTFGSPRIIRNLTSCKKEPIEIELNTILDNLNLTYEQFIELCVLFGCDYSSNIIDIKTSMMYKTYIKYYNMELTLNELRNMNYNVPNLNELVEAKNYFLQSIHGEYNDKLSLKKPNITKLIDILVNRYGLIKSKIITKVDKLDNYYFKFKEL
jgi:flap endonuclease-1